GRVAFTHMRPWIFVMFQSSQIISKTVVRSCGLHTYAALDFRNVSIVANYIKDGRVAFTHMRPWIFVMLQSSQIISKMVVWPSHILSQLINISNKEELEGYYHRCIAIIFKLNQQAADLMIPILLASGQYSFIHIQVKNYHSPYARADKNGEYLSIYWQLGYTGEWFVDPPNMAEKFEDQGMKGPVTRSHTKSEASQTKRNNKKIICMSSFGMDCFKTASPEHGEIWKESSIIRFRPYASRGEKKRGKQ
ncbi:18666_t:CDS:2, partial [Funneliformis geosporum]